MDKNLPACSRYQAQNDGKLFGMKARALIPTLLMVGVAIAAPPASRFVECETFTDYGGWVVDPHSMRQIGSS